ncbi:MAG: hypothetical protein ACYC65_01740 [Candidatus Limnocylindrales bacterium]
MVRRLMVIGFAVVVIAGCGSGSSSPSSLTASPTMASASAAATAAPAAGPTAAPTVEPTTAGPVTMTAACNAVGIRKLPSSNGALIVRIGAGTEVRVAEIVPGDAYEAGACGSAGDAWLKIDLVGGKDVKTLYGVSLAYAAAGFFR